jgi:uncharacterized repeat protein (TIGR02543 family)
MAFALLFMCIPTQVLATETEGPVTVLMIEGVNALENPAGDGWSFDAATGVLTLTNCDLTQDHTYVGADDTVNSIIYAEGDLIIELVGENHIERVLENVPSVTVISAITVWSNEAPLEIRGSGTLTAGISASVDMFDALSSTWMYGVATNMSADLTGLTDGGCVDVYGGLKGAAPRTDCGLAWNNYITHSDSAKVLSYDDISCAYQQSWYNWNENHVWRLIVSEGETTTSVAKELEWVPDFPENSGFSVDTAQELHAAMLECLEEQLGVVDYAWEGSRLFDVSATVWNPGVNQWEDPDFETVGSVQISVPLSALDGAVAEDEFFVLHVFEYGDNPGTFETPEATVSDGHVVFNLTGFSPVLITWRSPVTTYTVTFDSNGGSAVAVQNVEAGQKAVEPAAPTKDGFDFKGWTLNGSAYDFNSAVSENITLVASWEAQVVVPTIYTVTFDSNGGSAVAVQNIEAGQKATEPTAPTKDGFDFKGWTLNGSAYDFNSAVSANITLVASWEAQPVVPTIYTVTFDSNGGSAVAIQNVEAGQKATEPTAPTKDGFDFNGWTLNGSSYDFNSAVSANITLVASWEAQVVVPVEYTVTYIVDGVTYKTETYPNGTNITMPSVPNKVGYIGMWDKTVSVVTEDVTVTAMYTVSSDNPQTGDNSSLFLWGVLMSISGIALVLTVTCRKKMFV